MSPEALQGVSAVAVVTSSVLGRVLGNLMMAMTKRVRVRLLQDEPSALEWLAELQALEVAGQVSGDRRRSRPQRKKASVKPPSTGSRCPVVQRARGPARNRIAWAQSSGWMGFRVRARRA
jgi:hypothetical protein